MRVVAAVVLSLLIHALLAFGLGLCLGEVRSPDVQAKLDLASVELSFAERDDAEAAVHAADPMPPTPAERPRTPVAVVAPQADSFPRPEPLAVGDVRLPSPAPQSERLVTPPPVTPPPVAPRQARIDAPPQPRRAIRPAYPPGARRRGEQGDVALEIHVASDGTVSSAEVCSSSGYAELDAAAVRAAEAARFTPAMSGGRGVPSVARLTLSFRLR